MNENRVCRDDAGSSGSGTAGGAIGRDGNQDGSGDLRVGRPAQSRSSQPNNAHRWRPDLLADPLVSRVNMVES